MILKFEAEHPEHGMMGFADAAIKYYDDMERHMAFKYTLLVELFEGFQERKEFYRGLKTELKKQIELRGEKQEGALLDETDGDDFIPEEKIPNEMPNMFEEVRRRVADGKSGGITESNLNKMELDVICMCEAAKEYVRWLGRALVLVYNTSAKSKVISEEFKDILKTIDPGIQLSTHSASNSFSKDQGSSKHSVLIPAENEEEFYGLDANDIEAILASGRVTSRLLPCLRRMLTVSILNDNLIKVFLTKQTAERTILDIASRVPPEKPWTRNVHTRIIEELRDLVRVRIKDHIDAQCKKAKYALLKLQDRIIERYESVSVSTDVPRVTLFSVYSSITPFYRQKMLEKVESEREKKDPKTDLKRTEKSDFSTNKLPDVSGAIKAVAMVMSGAENSIGKHLSSSTANPSTYHSYTAVSGSELLPEKPYRFIHAENNYDQLLQTILSKKSHQETVKSTKKKAEPDTLFKSYYGQSEGPVFQIGMRRSRKFTKPGETIRSPAPTKVTFSSSDRAQTARVPIKVIGKPEPVSNSKLGQQARRSSAYESSRLQKVSSQVQLDELEETSSVSSANQRGKPASDTMEKEFRGFDDNSLKEVKKIIANMRLLDRVSTCSSWLTSQ